MVNIIPNTFKIFHVKFHKNQWLNENISWYKACCKYYSKLKLPSLLKLVIKQQTTNLIAFNKMPR